LLTLEELLNKYHTITYTGKWNHGLIFQHPGSGLLPVSDTYFATYRSAMTRTTTAGAACEKDNGGVREKREDRVFPPGCLGDGTGGDFYIQSLFFVSLPIAGRTFLIGCALHIVSLFLGSTPFRCYLTDTFNNFFTLAGWTWGAFLFGHLFLLRSRYEITRPFYPFRYGSLWRTEHSSGHVIF
jgi:hypothetical protein